MPRTQKQKYQEERLRRRLSPREQLRQLVYVPQALKLVWQAARGWTFASTIVLIVRGLLPGVIVYLTSEMTNAMVSVVDSNGDLDTLMSAVPVIALMAVAILLRELLGDVQSYINAVLAERTQDFMYNLIHDKTISLDMNFYESTSYYDLLQRAGSEAVSRPLSLLQSLNSLLENGISLLAMIGILSTLSWWVPFALVLGTIPVLIVTFRTTRKRQKWRLENTVAQRRLNYYKQMLSSDKAVPELRIFNLGEHFKQSYVNLRNRLREETLAILRKELFAKSGASLIGLLVLALMLGWMAWNAYLGKLDLGEIVMFWQAINQGRGLVRKLFLSFDLLYNDLLFLGDLFTFLELEPQVTDPLEPVKVPLGMKQGIEIKDITFCYPGSDLPALESYNLTIPKGKIVAIVGENGAGKSTLIKLLCRFFDPQQGQITWDGTDIKLMKQADLRRRITVLFQRPLAFFESASNNIRYGDLANNPIQAQIVKAAEVSEAQEFINNLPDGYETVLGKRFGNADLSIGQWQRIALARAFVRNADFIILDEPTSAMDSWAEIAWMKSFRNLVNKRTALIITHRFTTAMQADIIHVMVKGKIVESGTHNELVALNGLYSQSWQQQMQENG